MRPDVKTKLKLAAAFLLALVAVVLILQNRDPVETQLLFATVTMPRAILLLLTALLGFAAGILVSLYWNRKSVPPPAAGPEDR
jgi:uncharacterized integral membrane protein